MKRLCFVLSLVAVFTTAQNIGFSQSVKPGIYYGGDMDPDFHRFGYYLFFDDSSFILLNSLFRDSVITGVGYGTWNAQRTNQLILTYTQVPHAAYSAAKINYKCWSSPPFDSNYFSGRVVGNKEQPVFATIEFPDLHKSGGSDSQSGNFSFTLSERDAVRKLGFVALQYQYVEVSLNPLFNRHEFDVTLDSMDGCFLEKVLPDRMGYNFYKKDGEVLIFSPGFRITKLNKNSEDTEKLLNGLQIQKSCALPVVNWIREKIRKSAR